MKFTRARLAYGRKGLTERGVFRENRTSSGASTMIYKQLIFNRFIRNQEH